MSAAGRWLLGLLAVLLLLTPLPERALAMPSGGLPPPQTSSPPLPTPSAAPHRSAPPMTAPHHQPADDAANAADEAGTEAGTALVVVEQLRLQVPAALRQAWLEAERGSWEPFLARQDGFLGRELFWDPMREEATLLIRWASRGQWQAIPADQLQQVQERFERIARQAAGQARGNPFPLVFEGELEPQ